MGTPRLIYHYTRQSGLEGILKGRGIRATHIRHLNDPQEFTYSWERLLELLGLSEDPRATRLLKALKTDGLDPGNCYVACFSTEPDSLPMWRAYAHSEPGYALGFAAGEDSMSLPHHLRLVQCVYGEAEQRKLLDSHIQEFLPKLPTEDLEAKIAHALSDFTSLTPTLEHPGFAHEKEWRIVSGNMTSGTTADEKRRGVDYSKTPLDFRQGKSGPIPFRRVPLHGKNRCFPLAEIVVGPTSDPKRSQNSVESLLASEGLRGVPVKESTIPYRY